MPHQFDRECLCFECVQKARKERTQKPLATPTFNDDFQRTWDERQLRIYGSTVCSCGSGLYTEECCG